jgi:hypothetical protein
MQPFEPAAVQGVFHDSRRFSQNRAIGCRTLGINAAGRRSRLTGRSWSRTRLKIGPAEPASIRDELNKFLAGTTSTFDDDD